MLRSTLTLQTADCQSDRRIPLARAMEGNDHGHHILPQHHVFDGRIARSVGLYHNNLHNSINKRTCVATSIGFVRREAAAHHEWTTLGGVHSRILDCGAVPSEEGILGHGRTRVHVMQALWCTHPRRGLPPTDGRVDRRVDRVVDASSGWAVWGTCTQ